jgi:hypothetical protein
VDFPSKSLCTQAAALDIHTQAARPEFVGSMHLCVVTCQHAGLQILHFDAGSCLSVAWRVGYDVPCITGFEAGQHRRLFQEVTPRTRTVPPAPDNRICDYGDPFAKPSAGGCCEACRRASQVYTHFKDSDLNPSKAHSSSRVRMPSTYTPSYCGHLSGFAKISYTLS